MADVKPDVKHDIQEHINLKVVGQNGACTVHFKIKKHTSFKKLMQAFCDRQGVQRNTLRFTFDGRRIAEDDTPAKLEMEEDDIIEAFQDQTGGNE
ncbi:small ubiquitin-related modifier 2-like [Oscarella lobularis]|uniref:small ubiquitin-related modifier 2-like n=1 Tax=Oscarella lobularis TaxID=121494 RepID=UPI003313C7AA